MPGPTWSNTSGGRGSACQRRRLILVMAEDFDIDLDTRDVHATGLAW
ncbi:hypothetical protein ACX9I7_21090 [Streptomyces sp. L500]